MDGQNYESVQAIVDELDRRRPQLMEAGIYCPYSGGKATWQKPLEVNSVIYQYCVKNDVDLFTSFPMGLPPLDNLRNIHWVVQSSKTKNVLPETISIMPSHEVEKKIKPPKRTRAQIL